MFPEGLARVALKTGLREDQCESVLESLPEWPSLNQLMRNLPLRERERERERDCKVQCRICSSEKLMVVIS